MKVEIEFQTVRGREIVVLPNTLPRTMQQLERKFPGITGRVAAFKKAETNRRKRARKKQQGK